MIGKHASEHPGSPTRGRGGAGGGPFDLRTLAGWRRLLGTVAGLLLVASVVQEVRTPREQRTWHGLLLGFVPYDLRPPTLRRLKDLLWNPASHRLFTGRVCGVGWSVNLHEAWLRLRAAAGGAAPAAATPSVS